MLERDAIIAIIVALHNKIAEFSSAASSHRRLRLTVNPTSCRPSIHGTRRIVVPALRCPYWRRWLQFSFPATVFSLDTLLLWVYTLSSSGSGSGLALMVGRACFDPVGSGRKLSMPVWED